MVAVEEESWQALSMSESSAAVTTKTALHLLCQADCLIQQSLEVAPAGLRCLRDWWGFLDGWGRPFELAL